MGAEAADDLITGISDSIVNSVDISAWPQISLFIEFTNQNGQKVPCKIVIDLGLEAIGKFFDYIFSELFGAVPFASEAKTPPADPPYIPEKSL